MAVGYAKLYTIIDCKQSQAVPMAIKISIAGTKGPAKDWNPFLHSANKGFHIYIVWYNNVCMVISGKYI